MLRKLQRFYNLLLMKGLKSQTANYDDQKPNSMCKWEYGLNLTLTIMYSMRRTMYVHTKCHLQATRAEH